MNNMKLLIYGEHTEEIRNLAKNAGFEIVDKNPDMLASCGGDGTLMRAENDFPGIPKFILKKSKTSKKGHDLSPEEILEKISKGKYSIEEEIKISATFKNKNITGLNEIIVHNSDPRKAVRYEIFINGMQIGNEIIGDGVVVSTPYGSTGYYRSITDSFFEVGIGVAFNNSTEQSDHMVLKENSEIVVKITRGPAVAYADNSDEEIALASGDEIVIKKSESIAKIIKPL